MQNCSYGRKRWTMLARFFSGAKHGFELFGSTLTEFVTLMLLLLTYVLGIGIIAVPARVFGKRFLPFIKRRDYATSYWIARAQPKQRDFERMF